MNRVCVFYLAEHPTQDQEREEGEEVVMPMPKVLSVVLSSTRAQELLASGQLEIPVTSGPRIVINIGEPEGGR